MKSHFITDNEVLYSYVVYLTTILLNNWKNEMEKRGLKVNMEKSNGNRITKIPSLENDLVAAVVKVSVEIQFYVLSARSGARKDVQVCTIQEMRKIFAISAV